MAEASRRDRVQSGDEEIRAFEDGSEMTLRRYVLFLEIHLMRVTMVARGALDLNSICLSRSPKYNANDMT